MNRYKSAALPLALLYAALVIYASLYPFTGWRAVGVAPWAYLRAPLPQYWTRFDVGANLAGYAPLGFLLTLSMMRMRRGWPALTLATLCAAALSLVLEALQTYLPLRVASNVDLALNAAGGLLGALVAFVLERLGAIDRWRRLRARWFVRNSRGALVLLALWPIGLLFPAPVAFGMGQVFGQPALALHQGLRVRQHGLDAVQRVDLAQQVVANQKTDFAHHMHRRMQEQVKRTGDHALG